MKHTRVVSLNARQAKPGVHLVDTTRVCFIVNEHTTKCSCFYHTCILKMQKYIHLCDEICVWFHLKIGNWFCRFYQVDWWNLMKQSVTVGAQLLWSGRYGCNNGRYGCTIVMSYIDINKAVSQWLLTFNLCVSVTWPLTCAFHIPCTHTPEIIDMHRGMCDNILVSPSLELDGTLLFKSNGIFFCGGKIWCLFLRYRLEFLCVA